MGLKVNIFVAFVAFYSIAYFNQPCFFLMLTLIGFNLLYNYWKNWQYLVKIPGGKGISLRGFFENSSKKFYENLQRLWVQYGKDKFVIWIGFERFVAVSKYNDVKVGSI